MILCVLAQYALTGWSEWRRGDDGRTDFADEEKQRWPWRGAAT
jgi:hypothetical protein